LFGRTSCQVPRPATVTCFRFPLIYSCSPPPSSGRSRIPRTLALVSRRAPHRPLQGRTPDPTTPLSRPRRVIPQGSPRCPPRTSRLPHPRILLPLTTFEPSPCRPWPPSPPSSLFPPPLTSPGPTPLPLAPKVRFLFPPPQNPRPCAFFRMTPRVPSPAPHQTLHRSSRPPAGIGRLSDYLPLYPLP
jgi:hypothetical protein